MSFFLEIIQYGRGRGRLVCGQVVRLVCFFDVFLGLLDILFYCIELSIDNNWKYALYATRMLSNTNYVEKT